MPRLAAGEAPARAPGAGRRRRSATRAPSRSTSASSPRPTRCSRTRSSKGAFREDLYYRLNVVTLELPPLRERGEDVVVIAQLLPPEVRARSSARRCAASRPARSSRCASTPGPGNIRELENRIKKAVVLADKAARLGRGPRPRARRSSSPSSRSPRPRRSSRSATSTRCSSGTTATAPRPRRTSASIRAPSSATSRSSRPSGAASRSPPDEEGEP